MTIAGERFSLEAFEGGGLLLDLRTGALLRMNDTATLVWSHAMDGMSAPGIAALLADRFGITAALADADVAAALAAPDRWESPAPLPLDEPELRYESNGAGYTFCYRGRAAIEVEPTRQTVRIVDAFGPDEVGMLLRALAPKLVALLGFPVLHASAVELDGRGALICLGQSGAGKTTTARALVRAGSRPLGEDKLVMRIEGGRPLAVHGGETVIRRWIEETRAALCRPGGDACSFGALARAGAGSAVAVQALWLLDEGRRLGTDLLRVPLAPVDAAADIFRSAFHGSSSEREPRRLLSAAATLAREATAFVVTMPAGLEPLRAAVSRYTATTAS